MQMRNRFAAIAAIVDHKPVTSGVETQQPGDMGGFQQQMAQQCLIFLFGRSNPRKRGFGHDEYMNRRLRRDVVKRQDEIILISDLRRDLAGDDFLE
ncbi:MAG: hypothetical protein QOF48_470 [Verrucomicrobiota bacterium]